MTRVRPNPERLHWTLNREVSRARRRRDRRRRGRLQDYFRACVIGWYRLTA